MKPYSLTFMCLIFLSVLTANVTAQADKSTRPSPPMEVKGKLQGAQVNISYSSPSVKGRTIWGDLVPYGKVWRTEWIWIVNSVWDQWGAYKYDESKDVVRINTPAQKSPVFHEQLRFDIINEKISLSWENLLISL